MPERPRPIVGSDLRAITRRRAGHCRHLGACRHVGIPRGRVAGSAEAAKVLPGTAPARRLLRSACLSAVDNERAPSDFEAPPRSRLTTSSAPA